MRIQTIATMAVYKVSMIDFLKKFFSLTPNGYKSGTTDKPCGEGVRMLTQKHVAKRYMFAEKLVPLHYES